MRKEFECLPVLMENDRLTAADLTVLADMTKKEILVWHGGAEPSSFCTFRVNPGVDIALDDLLKKNLRMAKVEISPENGDWTTIQILSAGGVSHFIFKSSPLLGFSVADEELMTAANELFEAVVRSFPVN